MRAVRRSGATTSAPRPERALAAAGRLASADAQLDPVHAAATEAACDLDRDRFERRPTLRRWVRPALEHEFCPILGRCVPMAGRSVSVINMGAGLRVRTLL